MNCEICKQDTPPTFLAQRVDVIDDEVVSRFYCSACQCEFEIAKPTMGLGAPTEDPSLGGII